MKFLSRLVLNANSAPKEFVLKQSYFRLLQAEIGDAESQDESSTIFESSMSASPELHPQTSHLANKESRQRRRFQHIFTEHLPCAGKQVNIFLSPKLLREFSLCKR